MMKLFLSIFFVTLICVSLTTKAQVEKVIVETYYVSDSTDATDTTGGYLEPGSVTYRIYVDLEKGSKLKMMYGDSGHALLFSSTLPFFNNKSEGQTFGKDFSRSRLGENTVALDSWITLGQTTRTDIAH